ncbi:MAG: ABC transporter ATP-binding protein [Nitrospinales bacterium]
MIQADFLIEIKDVDVYLKGSKILSAVNWSQRPDENWAVVGNNGAGKTTFLRLLFGEVLPAFGGTIHWFGRRELRPLQEIRQRVGYVSAEYQADYDANITGLEVVESGYFSSIGLYERASGSQRKTALDWMDFLGIAHLADRGFRKMSFGEARRALLARALVNNPDLLILDEPCAGLDIPSRELFLETAEKLSATQTRLIYVTHHVEEILPAISHVLYLKQGRTAGQGRKEDMLESGALSEALDCRITLRKNSGRYWVAATELQGKNTETH